MFENTHKRLRVASRGVAVLVFAALLFAAAPSTATRALFLRSEALKEACPRAVKEGIVTALECDVLLKYSETLDYKKVHIAFEGHPKVPKAKRLSDYIAKTEMLVAFVFLDDHREKQVEQRAQRSGPGAKSRPSASPATVNDVLGKKTHDEVRYAVEHGDRAERKKGRATVPDALRTILRHEAMKPAKPASDATPGLTQLSVIGYEIPLGKTLWYHILPEVYGARTDIERGWIMRHVFNVNPPDAFGSKDVTKEGIQWGAVPGQSSSSFPGPSPMPIRVLNLPTRIQLPMQNQTGIRTMSMNMRVVQPCTCALR